MLKDVKAYIFAILPIFDVRAFIIEISAILSPILLLDNKVLTSSQSVVVNLRADIKHGHAGIILTIVKNNGSF